MISLLLGLLGFGWLAQPALAQIDLSKIVGSSAVDTQPYAISAQFTPIAGGQPARLFVTAKIEPGWHVYSVTQPPGGPVRTKITLDKEQPATIAGDFRSIPQPEVHPEPAFNNLPVETHAGSVTWYAPLNFAASADPAALQVKGHVFIQACTQNNCLPPKSVAFTAAPGPGVPIPPEKPQAGQKPAGQASSGSSAVEAKTRSHVQVSGRIEPTGGDGNTARLLITFTPDPGWHVYPLPTDHPPTVGKPTRLVFTNTGGLAAGTVHADHAPVAHPSTEEPSGETRYYEKPVTISAELTKPANVKGDQFDVGAVLGFMTCKQGACDLPEGLRLQAAIPFGGRGPATLAFEPARYIDTMKAAESTAAGGEKGAEASLGFNPKAVVVRDSNETASMPIWMAMLFGFAGGFILNFMPCVLPVIGLKILSFVEQSGHSRGRIFMLNLWYTLGMLSVFMLLAVLAVFFEFGWGQLFTFSEFKIALAGVVFAMALSFLGVWEIPIPGFVGSGRANDLAAREGAGGAFFKGVITTILATPCSGPFLGSALFWSVAQPPPLVFALFACIGLGMASPYLLIGAVPSLIRMLPRPGAWMDTFKQVMGFVLLGTVVYILTILPPPEVVPTVALLFGLWGACWWVGRTLLTARFGEKVRAWIEGLAFAALVAIVVFVPLGELSGGRTSLPSLQQLMVSKFDRDIEGAIAARMASSRQAGEEVASQAARAGSPDSLPWRPFSEARLVELTKAGKTVLVDFTADWCQTCKFLEHTVLNTADTRQAVDAGRVETLVADWTDMSDEIARMLEILGSKQLPVLAIFPAGRPNSPIVLRGGYSKSTLLNALEEAGPSKMAATENRDVMASR